MKKLIFILILAIGIAIYYLASVQVQPGSASVVYSGVSGLLPRIFSKEGRHFVWQRLIPGDTEVYSYPRTTLSTARELFFYLPPGELPVFGKKKEFEVKTMVSVQLTMGDTSPLLLAAAGYKTAKSLTKEMIQEAGTRLQETLSTATDRAIRKGLPPDPGAAVKTALSPVFIEEQKKKLALYGITLKSFTCSAVSLPDADNYLKLRRSLAKTHPELAVRLQQHYRNQTSLRRTKDRNKEELRRLGGIAKLVTKYPGLLDYLAVTRLSEKLRIALVSGGSNPLKMKLYQEMLDKMLQRLPAAKPININIRNRAVPKPIKNVVTNQER